MIAYRKQEDLSHQELVEITELVHKLYRYDFREYAKASLKRRLLRIMDRYDMDLNQFLTSLKSKPAFIQQFITELTVNVTEIFRDPYVFSALEKDVLPKLATQEKIRVWHAGCSSGEEVISTAILFEEAGLLRKSSFIGTDLNPNVVFQAKTGLYKKAMIEKYAANYLEVPGKKQLNDYFQDERDNLRILPAIHERCSFAVHNLVSDTSPGQFDLILCRNVYIYFELSLQEKVLKLLYDSLNPGGYLCLGSKESIRFTGLVNRFEEVNAEARIFKKID
ncbi:MAG: protein-glutamate O-methyltransferase CheR [Bacteroidetes bacterium]|nr:MAG: protein-glutamate O-methyltransferase CheR [Bacteroidota bacterium]